MISASVDDRSKQERGIHDLKTDRFVINKSRYDSISKYLSPGPTVCCEESDGKSHGQYFEQDYDDLNVAIDEDLFNELKNAGVDDLLAKHYAHLFIRDPLVIFKEMLNQDDEASSDHFEVV